MASATPLSELGLILSYRCNMRCRYCPVFKKPETMSLEVLEKALEVFGQEPQPEQLRFFGGDPLLALDLVRETLSITDTLWPDPEHLMFELTTNGLLLDDEILEFFP